MSLPTITGVGRLVDDAELRFTSGGKAVAKMRIAFSARKKDPATGEWSDGDKCFLSAEIWDQAAESCAESLTRGMEVVVSGRLRQREFETREGEKRQSMDLLLDSIGPSLRYATAKVQKMQRSSGGSGFAQTSPAPGADDPWATAAPAPAGARQAGNFDEEPPF
jgi:single-strand DNA-binding protein